MADERLLDEEHYFRTRDGQLAAEAERRGISRRCAADGDRRRRPAAGRRRSLGDARGTRRRPRPGCAPRRRSSSRSRRSGSRSSARTPRCAGTRSRDQGYKTANERFFVRNHTATPLIDAATWQLRVFGSALRGSPDVDHARTFSYRDLRKLPCQGGHGVRRVRRQRPQLLREPAGHARAGIAVEARGDRRRALARRPARARAQARRASSAGARSTSCPRDSTRRSSRAGSTPATCGVRCRSRRRSTTRCSSTR